jgi:lipopolysaccharide transport system ATP-binding protein
VSHYLASGTEDRADMSFGDSEASPGSEYVRLLGVRVRNAGGEIASTVDGREPLAIEVEYRILKPSRDLRLGVSVSGRDGSVLLSSKDLDTSRDSGERLPGRYVSRCQLPGDFLNYGQYFVTVGADFPMVQGHFRVDRVLSFNVEHVGGAGAHIPDGREGLIRMNLPWQAESLG